MSNFLPKQKRFGDKIRWRQCHYEKEGGVYRYYGIGVNYEVWEQMT